MPLFDAAEMEALSAVEDRLWDVRCALHVVAGAKLDVLPLDLLRDVARLAGHGDERAFSTGEGLLSELAGLFEKARAMRLGLWVWLTEQSAMFRRSPGRVRDVFAVLRRVAEIGRPPSWDERRSLSAIAAAYGPEVSAHPLALPALLGLLRAEHALPALEIMLETEILSAMLPEWAEVRHLKRADPLHRHAVDRHGIETAAEVGRMRGDQRYAELWAGLERWGEGGSGGDALLLAALLHDVGKARPDHGRAGAQMARAALARLGAPREMIEDVAWLIERHLWLWSRAERADLGDETTVVEIARQAESVRRLDMLYLLSVADAWATGPLAWNEWRAALLAECHAKARRVLERGLLSAPHAARRMVATRDRVRLLAAGTCDMATLEARLSAMNPRYVLAMDASRIVGHFPLLNTLSAALAEERVRVPHGRAGQGLVALGARPLSASPDADWELTFAARDQPGLFAALTGVLSLHGRDIHAAQAFTWSDDTVLDVFRVSGPPDPHYADELWTRVRLAVKAALTGRLDMAGRLAERRASPLAGTVPVAPEQVRVHIDNAASDFLSVIEVRAPDRVGRLYELAVALKELGLSVQAAKAVTMGAEVRNVFFVRLVEGGKLPVERETEAAERLRRAACAGPGQSSG